MITVESFHPHNLGWLEVQLDHHEVDHLWKCIEEPLKDWKHKLIGQIDSSYLISDKGNWFFRNVLVELCKNYRDIFFNIGQDFPTTNTHPYTLKEMWVNYQKQTEFNPVHSHTGVYSFVVWMQIPTNYNDQKENPIAKKSNGDVVSNFQINYVDILGKMQQHAYQMTKKFEGRMLFFPSELHHCVYPFYNCDKDRISISGNICLDTSVII
jgi:hypothetical protein|tara:strand:+ start:330 stop:959 length:630 start_codon:yes stop_codon:yes gene_type:complete